MEAVVGQLSLESPLVGSVRSGPRRSLAARAGAGDLGDGVVVEGEGVLSDILGVNSVL